jgi:catechol 2,3-dioxygenase-like lactoylglutathione lyase family enzyme
VAALLKSASIGAITLFTEDLERSKSFYQDAFGLSLLFEDADSAVFKFDNTLINLLNGPVNRAWGVRTASFTDPGGHVWEIAQDLPEAGGS